MRKSEEVFEPYGSTIFCEDIRQEINGMVTIVGAFVTNIRVPEFPIVIPKFGIITTVIIPKTDTKTYNIKLQIFIPGDRTKPSVEVENSVTPDIPPEEDNRDPDIPPHVKILQHLGISPLELKEAGHIKVRVLINGQTIKAGVIKVQRQASQPSPGQAIG